MDIAFRSRRLQKTFNSEKELQRTYGDDAARRIMRRMAALSAAPTLAEVPHTPPERRHALAGARHGQFAVDVSANVRLVFEPNHKSPPLKDDGGLDLARVTSIVILTVEDYH